MRSHIKTLVLLALCATVAATTQAQTPAQPPIDPQRAALVQTYEAYVRKCTAELERYKLEVEKAKTRQLQYRAQNDQRSAQSMDATVRQYTTAQTVKQQELAMYTQAAAGYKGPRSAIPTVAAAQDAIVALTMEKAQLTMRQTQASSTGNQAEAQRLNQQAQQKQAQIAAKQQEMKLMELQAKTGMY